MRDFKGALSPETEKLADKKFKFKNKIIEAGDKTLIKLIDNNLFEPLMNKLSEEVQDMIVEGFASVIEEMDVIEI